MYNELNKYLKRPDLYERTTEKFWTDPHIAAQMLKAHLDPTTDAASYKPEFIDRSVEWILSLPLLKNPRLLDIGCGPGLYTRRFAKQGLEVTGLDFSENSLKYAREHDGKSEYMLQDYLAMEFDSAFDIVIMISCDFGALIPDERRNLFRRVYHALKPGGLFLFDVFTPLIDEGKTDRTRWSHCPNGGFMSPNPHICFTGDFYYGETAAGCRTVVIEEKSIRCYNLWNCYFTKESLLNEAAAAGFTEEGFYSDVTGKPCTEDAQISCAVLKKKAV